MCAYANVRNEPSRGAQDARNIRATLRYTDAEENEICEIEGRWAYHPQDFMVERTQAPSVADIPAHGGNFKIDLGLIYFQDDAWFAFNDESRFRTLAS